MKRKLSPMQRLVKQNDRLWQERVQERDKGRCQLCGKESYAGHHIIYKSRSNATRWMLDNGISVCKGCHFRVHNSNPAEMNVLIRDRIGKERFNRIVMVSKTTIQFNSLFVKRMNQALQ